MSDHSARPRIESVGTFVLTIEEVEAEEAGAMIFDMNDVESFCRQAFPTDVSPAVVTMEFGFNAESTAEEFPNFVLYVLMEGDYPTLWSANNGLDTKFQDDTYTDLVFNTYPADPVSVAPGVWHTMVATLTATHIHTEVDGIVIGDGDWPFSFTGDEIFIGPFFNGFNLDMPGALCYVKSIGVNVAPVQFVTSQTIEAQGWSPTGNVSIGPVPW